MTEFLRVQLALGHITPATVERLAQRGRITQEEYGYIMERSE